MIYIENIFYQIKYAMDNRNQLNKLKLPTIIRVRIGTPMSPRVQMPSKCFQI